MALMFVCTGLLFLTHVHCKGQTSIELEQLISKPELNGRSCAANDTVVRKLNDLDLVSCAIRCHSITACTSFFYSSKTKHCQGCSKTYGKTTLLPIMDGTIYMYRRAHQTAFNTQSYHRAPDRLNFYRAQTYCEEIGGYVLQVGSDGENQFAADLMGDRPSTWLGLTDEHKEGNWLWLHPDKATGYTNWKPDSDPTFEKNQRQDQNCAAVIRNATHQWGDRNCATALFVICELL